MRLLSVLVILFFFTSLSAQNKEKIKGPIEYVYDSTKAVDLKAYIFFPIKEERLFFVLSNSVSKIYYIGKVKENPQVTMYPE